MKALKRAAALATAASLALISAMGQGAPASAQGRPELGRPGQGPASIVSGEILVRFKPGARGQDIAALHAQHGTQEKDAIPELDVRVLQVPVGQERARVAGPRAKPNVDFVEPHGQYFAVGAPTDARAGQQWQYANTGQTGGTPGADMRAYKAWDATPGSTAVGIAILDSGVDQSHEDLKPKLAKNVNFTRTPGLDDKYGHGTHVAGSAAAATNNGVGVAGACPNCRLLNVKVIDDRVAGDWAAIAKGITWAADNGARVISMSLGAYAESATVKSAVDYAWGKNVVLVAAALNDGNNWAAYPAAWPNVVAVAATDHRDARWGSSNWGGNWVDIAAPGDNILSTATDHSSTFWPSSQKYGTLSGTSMATPHVAGVAGLVWSKSGLCTTNQCVVARLTGNADPIPGTGPQWEDQWANGRLNACRAVGGSAC